MRDEVIPASCETRWKRHGDQMEQIKVTDVFRSLGKPTVTYVHREQGRYEHVLSSALDDAGQLCLITGPSKTGKTTLYQSVLAEKHRTPLVIRCDDQLTPSEFWRRALEQVK